MVVDLDARLEQAVKRAAEQHQMTPSEFVVECLQQKVIEMQPAPEKFFTLFDRLSPTLDALDDVPYLDEVELQRYRKKNGALVDAMRNSKRNGSAPQDL